MGLFYKEIKTEEDYQRHINGDTDFDRKVKSFEKNFQDLMNAILETFYIHPIEKIISWFKPKTK